MVLVYCTALQLVFIKKFNFVMAAQYSACLQHLLMSDTDEINLLNATAILDFTRRVKETQIPMDMSPDIYKAIQFISNHTNQQISVVDVAEHLGMDRSSFSISLINQSVKSVNTFVFQRNPIFKMYLRKNMA